MAQRTGAYGLVALLAVAFVVSGCGGGSATQTTGASSQASAPSETTSETTTATKQPKPEPNGQGKQEQTAKKPTKVVIPRGKPEQGLTPKEEAETPVADMAVSSPAVDAAGALSSTYTCDGKGISLPLAWQGIPPDSEELALFVMNLVPVEGELFFDWAVAGIDPATTTSLEAGEVPSGAVVGQNSEGKQEYSLCPPGSAGETYVVALYALDEAADPKPGFDPLQLREEAREASDSVGLLSMSYTG